MKTFIKRMKVETVVNALCALALTSGCIKTKSGQKDAESNVANVAITVPDAIKNMSDINGQTLITGYRIEIKKVDETGCKFENINKFSGMSDFKFNYSVSKSCSYLVTMVFGKLSGDSITPIYFSTVEPKAFSKAEVNLDSPKISLSLISTPEFDRDADKGSKDALAKGFNDLKPTPQPTPTSAPQIGKISDGWDLDIVASDKSKMLLSDIVSKAPSYLLDFSQASCLPCLKFAQNIERISDNEKDVYVQDFRALFLNPSSSCKFATVVTSFTRADDAFTQLTSWLSHFDSSVTSHTFGTDLKLNGVANANYASFDVSPTFMFFSKSTTNPIELSRDDISRPIISDAIKNACK